MWYYFQILEWILVGPFYFSALSTLSFAYSLVMKISIPSFILGVLPFFLVKLIALKGNGGKILTNYFGRHTNLAFISIPFVQ